MEAPAEVMPQVTALKLSYNDIATKLLSEKLLLTALELHAELCEAGRELPVLRDFFANPSNFESHSKPEPLLPIHRSSSQATLDSLDISRYSEDGGGVDERVAVLEFELRKARENISALRANLTVVTESETIPDKNSDRSCLGDPPIKPHEQRALNFLIYEYLLARSYKLTSITFSDENEDQDFEDWEDVGLNISKPPDLVQVYREFFRGSGYHRPASTSAAVQTDREWLESLEKQNEEREDREKVARLLEELESLQEQVDRLQAVNKELEQRLEASGKSQDEQNLSQNVHITSSNSTTPDKFEMLESPREVLESDRSPAMKEDLEEADSISVVVSLGDTDPGDKEWTRIHLPRMDITTETPTLPNSPSRTLPTRFKREVLAHCQITASPFGSDGTQDALIDVLAISLPKITPNIVLNKREEIIPLILNTIRLHPDPSEREKLLQLLFNLKKKPQEDERRILLGGLVSIVKLEDSPPNSEEVLTICWEQSQHKYSERRLLASECCLVLAPYTPSGLRNSLMISMLQQMLLEDKEPSVRASVVQSLSLLVAMMDDSDKYFQCEELALTALEDSSPEVFLAASTTLLPILAQWVLSLKRFQSHLLPRILGKLKNQLRPSQSTGKEHEGERACGTITVLTILLPHTIVSVACSPVVKSSIQEDTSSEIPREIISLCRSSITNPQVLCDDSEDIGIILNTFLSHIWVEDTWPELDWLTNKLLPELVEMVKVVDLQRSRRSDVQECVLNSLMGYFQGLCEGFGRYVTQYRIKKMFEKEVKDMEDWIISLGGDQAENLTLIPVYLTIVSTLDTSDLSKSIKKFVVLCAMSGTDITTLIIGIKRLCTQSKFVEVVLTALWDGVVHERACVRRDTAEIFAEIISAVGDRLVAARIAPAIVTLASDSDLILKAAVIHALGKLIMESGSRETKDKGRLTLETIAREPQFSNYLAVPLVTTLAHIAPNCPQHYVEEFITSQLTEITVAALQQGRREDLADALVNAYSIILYCSLSDKCVGSVLLPGLRSLETLVTQVLPQQRETVRSLIKEAESRHDAQRPIERSISASSGLSLSLATANVGQGVEDMRQRMSKIFTQKPNSPSMPSIFRKK
ncbi:lisH domain and HEAT repeat-containing protein KIAA1468-like [Fopius arisanus]|uniref:Kiaa1468_0 protein n=1 Tax=Fopius arisanus TaxID=64838 RepID=A0A0C9QCM0_9HYME|nr:PREDICTED: lisH domain and HEAT repeat-containing protein KIAA1468-like [Fopius arisanus]XP_011301251.1 PREDICTED: lisH domain and HEAT repeat-containing protein KIAA1468-like [Fopius arisanus]